MRKRGNSHNTEKMETKNAKRPSGQTNAYAMQYGVMLGLVCIGAFAAFMGTFAYAVLSTLALLLCVAVPVLACLFTLRFRDEVSGRAEAFGFARGFLHTLLMMFYASIWLALAVYIYFAYIDGGFFVDAYVATLRSPEVQSVFEQNAELRELYGNVGTEELELAIEQLRGVSPAHFAAASVYLNMMTAPVLALFVGLVARRGHRHGMSA